MWGNYRFWMMKNFHLVNFTKKITFTLVIVFVENGFSQIIVMIVLQAIQIVWTLIASPYRNLIYKVLKVLGDTASIGMLIVMYMGNLHYHAIQESGKDIISEDDVEKMMQTGIVGIVFALIFFSSYFAIYCTTTTYDIKQFIQECKKKNKGGKLISAQSVQKKHSTLDSPDVIIEMNQLTR